MAKTAMKLLLATALTLLIATIPIKGAGITVDAKSFAPFWAQFKTAVANKNKEAIAELTKFPLAYRSSILTKADFMKQCDALFCAKVQKCLRDEMQVKADDRDSEGVYCGL